MHRCKYVGTPVAYAVRMCARCMCVRSATAPPRVVRIVFPSRRRDCGLPKQPRQCSPYGDRRESGCSDRGGTHPKRGDPIGTGLSSASDCVDRRSGTLIAGRYGELCPGKAGGQWTCRLDIYSSQPNTPPAGAFAIGGRMETLALPSRAAIGETQTFSTDGRCSPVEVLSNCWPHRDTRNSRELFLVGFACGVAVPGS